MANAQPREAEQRLTELAAQNPSLGGRALLLEILARGPAPASPAPSPVQDWRTAFGQASVAETAYRSPHEQADWLGEHSQELRDLYEHGATLRGAVVVLPAEAHALNDTSSPLTLTTLAYAQQKFGDTARAQEFYELAQAISGTTADTKTQLVVFQHYYQQLARDAQGHVLARHAAAPRQAAQQRVLAEMRELAAALRPLETRESVEVSAAERSATILPNGRFERTTEAPVFNQAARTVRLNDDTLRWPAGVRATVQERLLRVTLPELDRRLETGVPRETLRQSIDATFFTHATPTSSEAIRQERRTLARLLKDYVAERLRDPETRALNTSPIFRAAHTALQQTTTPAELGRAAASLLRTTAERSPLTSHERKLLFNGRAPDHHTAAMRELRLLYGLSPAARADRLAALRSGQQPPSSALQTLLDELSARPTVKAVAHLQASLLNPAAPQTPSQAWYTAHDQLAPHERAFWIEQCEARKQRLAASRPAFSPTAELPREAGEAPRDSPAYRRYMAEMGRIERTLLNHALQRRQGTPASEARQYSITEARQLLPASLRTELRDQARTVAWQRLLPADSHLPEAAQVQATITHLQDQLQQRARVALTARDDFWAELSTVPARGTVLQTEGQARAQYATQMREAVYRGFELLDIQFQALEQARQPAAPRTPAPRTPAFAADAADRVPESPLASHARHVPEAPVPASKEASRETLRTATLPVGYVASDQAWHVDSLQERLAILTAEAPTPSPVPERTEWQPSR
jgi:hypothetical protein